MWPFVCWLCVYVAIGVSGFSVNNSAERYERGLTTTVPVAGLRPCTIPTTAAL